MIKAAVVGATGYTGEELIKLLLKHPSCNITYICAMVEKAQRFSDIFGWAKGRFDLMCDNLNVREAVRDSEVVFLALPHTVSMQFAPAFLEAGKTVIDLSADYRLKDAAAYKKWYHTVHKDAHGLKQAVYGLPELYKDDIINAKLIANPGCYPTSAILACAPLFKEKFHVESVIIDSKSGVSGAGRKAALGLIYPEINENFKAYKINEHQHMPEIEQELAALAGKKVNVTFVPHLLPVNRGILSTIYVGLLRNVDCGWRNGKSKIPQSAPRLRPSASSGLCSGQAIRNPKLIDMYREFYKDAPFVRIKDEGEFPQLRDVVNTNYCDIGIKQQKDKLIIVSAIDNLLKGASGQAVQNMNIICGFSETAGLL